VAWKANTPFSTKKSLKQQKKRIFLFLPLKVCLDFSIFLREKLNQEVPQMNKIAKIAAVVSLALALVACGEDKKKAEAEAAAAAAAATAAAAAQEAAAAAEKALLEQARQDSITAANAAAEIEAKRIQDSIDSVATSKGKKAAPKAAAPAPVAAPVSDEQKQKGAGKLSKLKN
jgi:pyruvate/2-oxoglutarate dehydrogenase complex dihydrolipoamide acyltransferase (E2) component